MLTSNKPYFENLDGLRFFCFLSVFFYHSFHTENPDLKASETLHFLTKTVFTNGNLGVNFFFVLSGFLITYLLIKEKAKSQINIPKFWMRRILRIWPLYYFCVAFGFILFPWIKTVFGETSNETANILYYLTFTSNFDLIHNLPDCSVLSILWSVAIEEQFYLLWPILLSIIPARKYWVLFVALLVISFIFRFHEQNENVLEMHSLSCMSDMVIGGFGAWAIIYSKKFKANILSLNKFVISILYLTFWLIFFFRKSIVADFEMILPFERAIIAIIMIMIILEQNYSKNSIFKLSKLKMISELGKITYGLYCLHFIGILITLKTTGFLGLKNSLWNVVFLETGLSLLLSIIIAKLSYRWFEKPFLKLKNKFSTL
jgi:peptidoglycan/LPS O-acetylase OafA/YrhL